MVTIQGVYEVLKREEKMVTQKDVETLIDFLKFSIIQKQWERFTPDKEKIVYSIG